MRIGANIGPPIMLHKSHGRDIKSPGLELELKVDDVDVWYKRLTNQGSNSVDLRHNLNMKEIRRVHDEKPHYTTLMATG